MNQDDVSNLHDGTSGGISIEDPNLFSYNGRWYFFAAELTNPDVSIGSVRLVNRGIDIFEYTNEINSLCMKGTIRYTDVDGQVSKFFNMMDNHLIVGVKQMQKKVDGGQEIFVDMNRGKENSFTHTFIVQNMGIVDRQGQAITYELELISELWYKTCAQLVFSNYGPAKENPKKIYEIMQLLFLNDNLLIEPTSFANVIAKSELELDYTTTDNDTIETILPYLFDRTVYNKKQQDDSLKFIAYDPINNWYRLIDYNDVTSWPTIAKPTLMLSLFETQYERMLYARNSQMASVVAKKQTDTYSDLFPHDIWKYDSSLNELDYKDISFDTKDIVAFSNKKSDSFKSSVWPPKIKYTEQLNQDWFKLTNKYQKQTSLWNNDNSIYQSVLDNLMKRDAFIINTDGDVTHQPGCVIGVILDRSIEKSDDISPEQLEELYKKHRQLEGMAQIFKVRHMYKPSTPNPFYTENVVFGRNFLLETNAKIASGNRSAALGAFVWNHRTGR